MRLPFRKKDKKSDAGVDIPAEFRPEGYGVPAPYPPTLQSTWLVARLPPSVLERIFSWVCPHARDESYDTCEQSGSEKGCMLCDLRNLAHCIQVCRSWRVSGIKIL